MQIGYYWAKVARTGQWVVVEVVERLNSHVLYRGMAAHRADYSAFVGPLPEPPSDDAQPAWTVPVTMRRRAQETEE